MRRLRFLLYPLILVIAILGVIYGCDERSADDAITSAPLPTSTPVPTPAGPAPTPTPFATPMVRVVTSDFAFTAEDFLSTVGIGRVLFGDSLDKAAETLETTWVGMPGEPWPSCFTVSPADGPPGTTLTVVDGAIRRVDITNDLISTRSGARVGIGQDELLTMFPGRTRITDLGDGIAVEFIPQDEKDLDFRIYWVTDGVQVVSMRSGELPTIEPDVPCS